LGIKLPNMGLQPSPTPSTLPNAASLRTPAQPKRAGLIDALFTLSQQRVLGLLFGQPTRSFFANELVALSAGGSGAIQRELAKLADSGLVLTTRVGNQKHHQANAASPIYSELVGIFTKTVAYINNEKTYFEALKSILTTQKAIDDLKCGRVLATTPPTP
jgi:hypothetical protein